MRAVALLIALCACAADPGAGTGAGTPAGAPPVTPPEVAVRPYDLHVPDGYDGSRPFPLVVLLHGYGASGMLQEAYFNLTRVADSAGFLYATPDGTLDSTGKRFWNATDACCDFAGTGVDDVAYVRAIIDDVSQRYSVDPKRVYLVGHSNGGFLSHRLACELSGRIAAIVSLAGAQASDVGRCQPEQPVAVLQVHGDLDSVILYGGGLLGTKSYPSASDTVAAWAMLNGCDAAPTDAGVLNVEPNILGDETRVERHGGCRAGGAAELWTIRGGAHIPRLVPGWGELVWGFLAAHPKP
jgi:polyhydroxybutyrate depolymerase